ncbi:hypothetical protein FNV43_RR09996 [Rhamnella rubrinervis]|uniref:SANTA domain-containing protein n=1 Tax=Rhamnella rubrinervis TaxID=2594499 RepID=A0A8K0HBT4_9ROSA|nr:hypothetical protein FNV43_RR09996 [Rhamnella rubrinervis]
MASNSCSNRATDESDNIYSTKDGLSSSFHQTVCLHDWWLIKAKNDFHGKRLAVAGFTSREWQRAVRVFSSAPIAKIYDVFTLETVDGVCVVLRGFINKQRTTENGFPSEVFRHFTFGFPSYWEQYAAKYLVEDSVSGLKTSTPTSIHFLHSTKRASCSVECKIKQTSLSPKTIGNVDNENLNTPSDAIKTIQTGNEVSVSEKSTTKLMGGTTSEGKGRNVIYMSGDKLHEPANLVEEINDDRVKDCLQPTSIVKQGHKFTNRNTQGSVRDVLTSQSDSSNERNIAVGEGETYSKEISSSRKKTKRKLAFDTHVTPCTRREQVKISVLSPESLSVGRSRSGRLLLPALEFWRNQMPIYDAVWISWIVNLLEYRKACLVVDLGLIKSEERRGEFGMEF